MADELPPVIARLIADTADFVTKMRAAGQSAKDSLDDASTHIHDDTSSIKDDMDDTAARSDNLGVRLGQAFSSLGSSIGFRVASAFGAFKRAEDDAAKSADDVKSKVGEAGRSLDDLARSAANASQGLWAMTQNFGNAGGASDALKSHVGIMATGITSAMGPLSGALLLGPVAAFAGIGIAAEKSNKQVSAAFSTMGTQVKATLASAFKPLVPTLVGIAGQVTSMVKSLAPAFKTGAAALQPILNALAGGVLTAVGTIIRGLAPILHSLTPVVQAIAQGLGQVAQGAVGLFRNLNVGPAAAGLRQIFSAIAQILPLVGKLVSALAPLGNAILSAVLPPLLQLVKQLVGALMPVIKAITPLVGPLVGVFVALAQTFMALVQAVAPLIAPVVKLITTMLGMDTVLEALQPLFKAVSQVIRSLMPIITQIAGIVAGALTSAFVAIAKALAPLIPVLGQVARTLLQALLTVVKALAPILGQLASMFGMILKAVAPLLPPLANLVSTVLTALLAILKPLMPAIMAIVKALISILPAVTPLITIIGQLVQAISPLLVILAKVVAVIAGPVANVLATIITALLKVAAAFLGPAIHAVSDFVTMVRGFISGVLQIFKGLWEFVSGVFTGNWSRAWQGVKDIFGGMIRAIGAVAKGIFNIGADIIHGLINGIESAVAGLWHIIQSIGSGIKNAFKSVLSIFSPSRVMADEIGQPIVAGIAKGITDNLHHVVNAANQVKGAALGALSGTASIGVTAGGQLLPAGALGSGSPPVVVNVAGSIVDTQGLFNAVQVGTLRYRNGNNQNGLSSTFRRPATGGAA